MSLARRACCSPGPTAAEEDLSSEKSYLGSAANDERAVTAWNSGLPASFSSVAAQRREPSRPLLKGRAPQTTWIGDDRVSVLVVDTRKHRVVHHHLQLSRSGRSCVRRTASLWVRTLGNQKRKPARVASQPAAMDARRGVGIPEPAVKDLQ